MKEFETLRALPSTDQTTLYIAKVGELLAALSSHEETKQKLTEALKNYNATQADDLINQLSSSQFQKDILKIFLRMYQGNYDDDEN